MTKRNQKRPEPIGTRRLTRRSLQAAWRDSVNNTGDFPTPGEWKKLEAFGRAVEHHTVLLNQREVFALVTKRLGRPTAQILARDWTIPNR